MHAAPMNTHFCQVARKVSIVTVTLTSAIAWGCCYRANQKPSGTSPTESRIGWVRFVGEFALYDSQSAFERSDREHCVSGALPLDEQRLAAKTMDGRRVKVIGARVQWSLPDPLAVSLNNRGSAITNWCGGRFVLFATKMVPE
jgi:hypothetical protein